MANGKTTRLVSARRWSGLALTAASLGLPQGASGVGIAAHGPGWPAPAAEHLWLTQAEGGEGGESGAAAEDIAKTDTVALLTEMLAIEGHLAAGEALLAAGDKGGAEAQFALPGAKVYPTIEKALAARNAPEFETALDHLTDAAAKDAGALPGRLAEVRQGIDATRAAIAASPAEEFAALTAIVREAGGDIGAGLKDGKLAERGEYEDAWGYVKAAEASAARLASAPDAKVAKAAGKARQALADAMAAMPDVKPGGAVAADEALLLSAAARIELAAYGVR